MMIGSGITILFAVSVPSKHFLGRVLTLCFPIICPGSDNFTARANSIQNGTHPSPPINPVIPALEDIQSEVQDIVVGFETRIRGIKRKGERAFEPTHGGEPETDDVTGDGNGAREKHEEVRDSAPPVDIPHIVIGRNKEEVMEALNRVAEQHAHATSDVHSSASNPEQVVEQVVHEVEDQVSHPAPSHEEL